MAETILVVDDEKEIADLVALYLQNEGFATRVCYTGDAALAAIAEGPYALALLDVMLPGTGGFDLCLKIREQHNYPVIMLTAKDAELDKITGLSLGADDYITKPFQPLELVARVKAQLRRYTRYNAAQPPAEDVLVHKALVLDTAAHTCTLAGRAVELTPTEFSLLRILCEAGGRVVSAEELFRLLWPDEYYTKASSTITVHVRHLREKLGDSAEHPEYIKTVWGVGYKLG